MLSVSWRATSAAAAACGPSFVPPRWRIAGRHLFSGGASSPFAGAAAAGRRRSSLHDVDSHAHSRGRIKSPTTHLRSSHPFAATHNSTFASSEKEVEPFTWPRLMGLFRSSRNRDERYITSDHPNLALFRRSAAAQASYEQHKQYLDRSWRSAYDYLVVSKFGWGFGFYKVAASRGGSEDGDVSNPIEDDGDQNEGRDYIPPNENGLMYKARPSLTQASKYTIENGLTYLSLVPNDFPYDVAEGIEHWCLWKIGGCSITEGILRKELTWAMKELDNLPDDELRGSACILNGKEQTMISSVAYPNDLVRRPGPISDALYWVNPPHLQSMPEIHHAHMLVLRSDKDGDGEGFERKNDILPCPPPV